MSAEFDRYAKSYDGALAKSIGRGFGDIDRFAAYKVDTVAHYLDGTNVERLLDFGCGIGRSLRFLAQAFPRAQIFGFDPSADCIAEACRECPAARLTVHWEEIPRNAFDCVFAANVFHHIPAAERATELRKCADAVRAGGNIFVFEHNPYNPATRWVFDRCPFDRGASMIRRSEMMTLGRAIGLDVCRTAYTLFVPFRGRAWSALQRSIGWLPLGAQHYVQFTR